MSFKVIILSLMFVSFGYASEFPYQGAVMGYGNMGQLHAAYFSRLCKTPVYVIEIEENKVQLALEKGYIVYSSLDELLKLAKIDFVAICTPTDLHNEHIQEAVSYHLPVFVEKPIVKNALEVKEIRALNDPFIFVGEVEHYNPVLIAALEYASSFEALSIFRSVNLDFFIGKNKPWFLDPTLSGGIVVDLMIHDITLLIQKFGVPQIQKVESAQNIYSCVDQVKVELQFKDLKVDLHADWCRKDKEIPISVVWEFEKMQFTCEDYLKPHEIENDPYFIQDRNFLLCLKQHELRYPLEIYLQAVEVAEKVVK